MSLTYLSSLGVGWGDAVVFLLVVDLFCFLKAQLWSFIEGIGVALGGTEHPVLGGVQAQNRHPWLELYRWGWEWGLRCGLRQVSALERQWS